MAGIIKGGVYFLLGAASAVAAQRLVQRYAKETGKEGAELLAHGVGVALAAGREMTRKAARFMEEVEDMVAEAKTEIVNAQATASQAAAAPPAAAAQEPAAPQSGAERV